MELVLVKVLVYSILCVIAVTCDDESRTKVILKYDQEFDLECPEKIEDPDQHKVDWFKGDSKIEYVKRISINIEESKSKLTIRYPKSGDEGYYACKKVSIIDGSILGIKEFNVIGKAYVKVKDDISVIEGETLKVECIAIGTLPIYISWIVGDKKYTTSEGRVILSTDEEKVENNVLELVSVDLSDRGDISCLGSNEGVDNEDTPNNATVYIRVKGQYAALWPFLGIVIETILLVILIVACEKYGKKETTSSDEEEEIDKKITKEKMETNSNGY